MQVLCHYAMVVVVNCFSLLGVSSKSRLYGSFVDMFFLAVTFPGACMGLHQKHRGVKTGGMASCVGIFLVSWFSVIGMSFFILFVVLAVEASGRI